jgi:hypothetical protein
MSPGNLEQKEFMGITLNYGIRKINFVAFMVSNFNSMFGISILMVFSSFILQDKNYYNLSKS